MYLLTAPTAEPVTVAEVKASARIDDDRFDDIIPGLIAAARAVAEQETGRQLVEQTWRIELTDWPASDEALPVHRASAAAVSYWDGSAFVSLSGGAFVFFALGNGTALVPNLSTSWPSLGSIAGGPRVRIDLTAGVATGSASTVPEGIKVFIKALVGQMIQTPDLSAAGAVEAHPLLARLLDPWRLWS